MSDGKKRKRKGKKVDGPLEITDAPCQTLPRWPKEDWTGKKKEQKEKEGGKPLVSSVACSCAVTVMLIVPQSGQNDTNEGTGEGEKKKKKEKKRGPRPQNLLLNKQQQKRKEKGGKKEERRGKKYLLLTLRQASGTGKEGKRGEESSLQKQ